MRSLFIALGLCAGMISSALAADIVTKAPVSEPAVKSASVCNFCGLYFGGSLGYGQTNQDVSANGLSETKIKKYQYEKSPWSSSSLSAPSSFGMDADGMTIGGLVGYRWQFGALVLGPKVDWEWSNIRGTATVPTGSSISQFNTRVKNLGSVVAQVGYAPGPTMLFAEGGFAWGRIEHTATGFFSGPPEGATKTGWTVGGGVEHQFRDGWAAFTRYRYLSLGSFDVPVTGTDGKYNYAATLHGDNRIHEIQVGFTKKINWN